MELPEELSDRERSAFVGVDWKSLRWDAQTSPSPSAFQAFGAGCGSIDFFFGYNNRTPFGQMPKVNVRLGVLSYSVYDQNKRLPQEVVKINRTPMM